jgi:hypothetical protein
MKNNSQPSSEMDRPTVKADPPALKPATPLGVEAITCTECGTTDVKRVWPILRMLIGAALLAPLMLLGTQGRMIFMILVTIWIPCCLVSPSWRCRKCGKEWKLAALTARPPLAEQRPSTPENKIH